MSTIAQLHPRPADATLTVTKAAHVLGVHPNTIRAWSDAGRLRYYRINPRGDRRYRLGDLQRFLANAAEGPAAEPELRGLRTRRGRLDAIRHGAAAGPLPVASRRASLPVAETAAPARPGAHRADMDTLTALGRIAATVIGDEVDPEALLGAATRTIREGAGLQLVSVWRLRGERLAPVGVSGPPAARLVELPRSRGVLGAALATPDQVAEAQPGSTVTGVGLHGRELAMAVPGPGGSWGVLLAVTSDAGPAAPELRDLLAAAATAVATIVGAATAAADVSHRLHRAEALRRVAGDIGSRLDLDQILAGLVEHAMVLLGGDRASVLVFQPDGTRRAVAARNLSAAYLAAITPAASLSLVNAAVATGAPVFSVGFRDDPRAADIRAAVVQEGFDTLCAAPLFDGPDREPLGSLNVYHDEPHPWSADELETMQTLATQASVAIRTARNYAQLATWAAQLQSIQQLGASLSRLSSVEEVGATIATELRQLIDYHNVRVYRLVGDDLVPVAMRGQVGEYSDETPEQLGVKLGAGITGWVAENRVAQILHDAAADPRANTIPGTEDDLDESMLLAPMLFEDQCLGVLVLSKLGLSQFRDDDLRLLEIYASFAAQAMANADATEQLRRQSASLERQVRSQRELLQITESILTTLDVRSILEAVADRLGELVGWDNVAIELLDLARGTLTPVIAKGSDAAYYMQAWEPGEEGLATWVVARNEPTLVPDQFDDPRVAHIDATPSHGSLICVPLRGRDRAIGVLTLERTGEGRVFTEEEFELVKLFAAQVSIALQNAQAHGALAQRAQTDDLTGLLNHGSFRERLAQAVAEGMPFSVLMIDLDRFKLVNDTFGHAAGNDLLRRMAGAIVGASRDTDAAFRYGGDEFTVILGGTDAAHATPVAERIRCAIAELVGPGSGLHAAGLRLDASAGVATYPSDGTTPDEILLAADRACFVAKREGGGRVAAAAQGDALAGEFTLQVPTPIDFAPAEEAPAAGPAGPTAAAVPEAGAAGPP
ncbi:MAG TPA: GAF domain-containing protein [Candidatus Limnocylindrales bacterium]|nr:GAF domain-containing protein [Candidatus Limnocylindrales bacterium]